MLLENLKETNPDCANDVDAPSCDPCTKHYDYFFDKYDIYVLQNILSIIQKTSETEQK